MHYQKRISTITCAVIVSMMLAGISMASQQAKTKPHASKPSVKITAAQANATVLKKFPGKIVGTTKLENEEGVWQYGVMVKSGKTLREVMVNAKTGKIDSVEVTNAAKEKTEEKADAAKEKAPAHSSKATTKGK